VGLFGQSKVHLPGYELELSIFFCGSWSRERLKLVDNLEFITPKSSHDTHSTLTMTVVPVNVASLKKVKNSVIGNPSAKKQLAQDVLLIQSYVRHIVSFHLCLCRSSLVACLNPPHACSAFLEPHNNTSRPEDDAIRIEAAHVIASLAGSEEALSALLDHEAPHAFLVAISYFEPGSSTTLRSAIVRGLKSLAIAMANIAGPSQWGLKSNKSKIRNRTKDGLNYLFQVCET